jgi:hypothetical protein
MDKIAVYSEEFSEIINKKGTVPAVIHRDGPITWVRWVKGEVINARAPPRFLYPFQKQFMAVFWVVQSRRGLPKFQRCLQPSSHGNYRFDDGQQTYSSHICIQP